jgi:hypothetical protein
MPVPEVGPLANRCPLDMKRPFPLSSHIIASCSNAALLPLRFLATSLRSCWSRDCMCMIQLRPLIHVFEQGCEALTTIPPVFFSLSSLLPPSSVPKLIFLRQALIGPFTQPKVPLFLAHPASPLFAPLANCCLALLMCARCSKQFDLLACCAWCSPVRPVFTRIHSLLQFCTTSLLEEWQT